MKRKIRLTESEFHSLVRRLVRETQEEMNGNVRNGFMRMSENEETVRKKRLFVRLRISLNEN
jgi:hypothetical protein